MPDNKKLQGVIVTDPFSNTQTRFHRTDPTGRFIKLETEDPRSSWDDCLRYGFMCAILFGLAACTAILIIYTCLEVI